MSFWWTFGLIFRVLMLANKLKIDKQICKRKIKSNIKRLVSSF
jgi:hypothetical protein